MRQKPKIWFTILIATLLVIGLSFIFPKNEEKYKSELFWSRKTFAPKKYDVVLMGDSRVYRGLSPKKMVSNLPGMKILNQQVIYQIKLGNK